MVITAKLDSDSLHLALNGALTIYEVTAAVRDVLAQTENAQSVCVDLSGITDIDCAGLQLLLALQKEVPFVLFATPSQCVSDIVAATGLERHLAIETC